MRQDRTASLNRLPNLKDEAPISMLSAANHAAALSEWSHVEKQSQNMWVALT